MVPDEIQAILAINPWIALAVFTGIFIVGIPLQVWVMIRLANSIETESKWAWIAGAALPWVGLIVLWVFINKVQRIIDQNMPAQRPLTPTEEIKRMGNIGSFLIALNGILSFFLLGHWEYFGILGLVGLAIIAMAYIRRFPYDRKMSNAGFAKLWFADMSDYQKKMSAM